MPAITHTDLLNKIIANECPSRTGTHENGNKVSFLDIELHCHTLWIVAEYVSTEEQENNFNFKYNVIDYFFPPIYETQQDVHKAQYEFVMKQRVVWND